MPDTPRLARREDYQRYGRQMILDEIGLPGQISLQNAAVGVVGAGGLGCPAIQYLAAAGVGRIGIIDGDSVELSNLQRQVLHSESTLGINKAQSAANAVQRMNRHVHLDVVTQHISVGNALALLGPYNIILDCTDNAPTRYLLSDVAVRLDRPLVSGAAQRFEGQLCVYNLNGTGPCYRCLFPRPPPIEVTGSCEETGILGAVAGVIGNLQALETIKIITASHDGAPNLLIFSALTSPPFRSIKLRPRRGDCSACSPEARVEKSFEENDYVAFCGGARPDRKERGLSPGCGDDRVHASDLHAMINGLREGVEVIDVRSRVEYGICSLPNSCNVPLNEILAKPTLSPHTQTAYVVCRMGNDSQVAASALRQVYPGVNVKDLIGGLEAWGREVDENFPIY